MSDLQTFLRDTSVYLAGNGLDEDILLTAIDEITNTVQTINGEILDLDQGSIIELRVEPDTVHLELGELGKYLFPHTLDNLSQVHTRLTSLTKSPRFIKAIQGLWPA